MLYKTADEYIFKICNSSDIYEHTKNNDIVIYIPYKNSLKKLSGNIYSEDGSIEDIYNLSSKKNALGIKIGDGKYIYNQKRMKFVDSIDAQEIMFYDDYLDEKSFKETFKCTDLVEIYERNDFTKESCYYSFLVNGPSYLLLDHFHMYENSNNVVASLKKEVISSKTLKSMGFDNLVEEEENYMISKNADKIIVPQVLQILYNISSNGKSLDDNRLRVPFLNRIFNESLESNKRYYGIQKDIEFCFETVLSSLDKKFGCNSSTERIIPNEENLKDER